MATTSLPSSFSVDGAKSDTAMDDSTPNDPGVPGMDIQQYEYPELVLDYPGYVDVDARAQLASQFMVVERFNMLTGVIAHPKLVDPTSAVKDFTTKNVDLEKRDVNINPLTGKPHYVTAHYLRVPFYTPEFTSLVVKLMIFPVGVAEMIREYGLWPGPPGYVQNSEGVHERRSLLVDYVGYMNGHLVKSSWPWIKRNVIPVRTAQNFDAWLPKSWGEETDLYLFGFFFQEPATKTIPHYLGTNPEAIDAIREMCHAISDVEELLEAHRPSNVASVPVHTYKIDTGAIAVGGKRFRLGFFVWTEEMTKLMYNNALIPNPVFMDFIIRAHNQLRDPDARREILGAEPAPEA